MKKIDTPLFANEREEADWWFANQDVIATAFEEEHGLPKLDFVGVDIQGDDARLIQERAAAQGVEPHVYAEALLRAALHSNQAA